jgi:hypothetical protein
MTTAESNSPVPSVWKRILECSVFAGPVGWLLLIAVGSLVTLLPSGGGSESLSSAFGLAFGGGFLVIMLLVVLGWLISPVALYLDAEQVGDAGLSWEPNPVLYAVGGFFFSGLVTLHYLYKRHQHTVDERSPRWTWYLVAQFFLVAPASALVAYLVHPVALGAAALSVAAFLVGIYTDAAYVSAQGADWRPNPINYYFGAAMSLPFVVVPLLIAGYYLFRRGRAVGF